LKIPVVSVSSLPQTTVVSSVLAGSEITIKVLVGFFKEKSGVLVFDALYSLVKVLTVDWSPPVLVVSVTVVLRS
jgi:hypothetical protein